jgi:transposase
MVGPADLQRRGLRSQQQRTQAQSRKQEAGPMGEIRFVGLDVHKESIAIAVAEQAGGAPQTVATVPHEMRSLLKQLKKLASVGPIRCCYEAGPTGFALRRALQKEGIECVVIAPSLTPKQPGDRVKTDRRDAEKLARFYRSGDLTEVYVPDETTEAMRDLERAREDAKRAQGTARRQLQQFLLRHGRQFEGKTAWTGEHMEWIRYLKFDHEAHNRVLVDYVAAVENATVRLVALTKDIVDLVETWSMRPLVKALQALRGVQLLTAVTLVAEIGNFARFASAPKLMAYLGLVPSEHSSGEMTRRGRITRCGNRSVRTALVESAWNNRFRPKVSRDLKKRHDGVAPNVCAIAWKAQQRLHARYARLTGRGKNGKKTITAMARELAGFVWAIAREPELLTPAPSPSPTAHA